MFEHQVIELREFIAQVDEKIRIYRKQGLNTDRLQDNKARALHTIEKLKRAEKSNTTPLHGLR